MSPEPGPIASGPPSGWRLAGAILPLPFTAAIVVPGLILALGGGPEWGLEGVPRALATAAGIALLGGGLVLFASTVRLFASLGHGTLAPWDPPERLVVAGPYRYLRHPMIGGVALILAGEALVLGSAAIATWLLAFVLVNAVYLPLVEEPALVRRFGADYEHYMEHVPRWLPRLEPWDRRGA